jgi:ABC-2 type transport system ATP-binding protein
MVVFSYIEIVSQMRFCAIVHADNGRKDSVHFPQKHNSGTKLASVYWGQIDKGEIMNAIEVNDLKKSFGELQAVQGVEFSAEKGEILSLLGPNGAGKSTTISMLSGLLAPTAGDATIMGHSVRTEPQAAKASLGVVPQDIALYPDLSARENLDFWGKMYGLRGAPLKVRVDEVLEIIGLADRQKDHVGKFSGGMKRRVNIGAALLHKPDVVIMDEPTVGIDPQSRRHILDNVKELNRQGMTVLYTTHYMEEAAELSNHIAIMDEGKVIAYGTHDELIKLVGGQTRIDLTLNVEGSNVLEGWKRVDGVSGIDSTDGRVTVLVTDSNLVLPRLFDAASKVGVRITSVDIQEPNLETVFLHLTGRALRD